MYPILFLLLLQSANQAAMQADAGQGAPPAAAYGIPAAAAAAPAAAAPAAEVVALRGELERLIRSPGWRGDDWAVLVVSLDRGDTLFAHEPDLPLAPASNLKLFTSAAALYYLGPEFRYSTYLMTDGEVENGVLDGDLIVYGTGDPTIADRFYPTKTAVWEAFADTLAARGIREVRGDLVGDASYFGATSVGLGWQESYMNAWYAAPASALTFNENMVTLYIRPAAEPGWRPEVRLVPGGAGIGIVNQATTVRGGRTAIDVNRAAYDGPIVIRGQISTGSTGVWRAVPVADPARYAAAVLREVLESRGILVHGRIRSIAGTEESPLTGRSVFAPAFDDGDPLRVLAIHQSPSLLEILEIVNKKSHNLYAESALRTVGRVATGVGTVDAGFRAVRAMLECETGLDSLELRMFDGSGLSVLNRVSARTTIALLSYMANSPMWASYWATLPEAGDAEGLRRMHRTGAEGNLRAKTGTIDRVSALSGYVRAADGERLAFSIMSNNVPSTWRAKRVEDAIGARLAAFDRPSEQPATAPPVGTPGQAAPIPVPGIIPGTVATAGAAIPPPAAPATLSPDSGGVPAAPAVAAQAAPAADTTGIHLIRRGDTLEGIAKQYGTTVQALRDANPGVDPKRLMPGRPLRLP